MVRGLCGGCSHLHHAEHAGRALQLTELLECWRRMSAACRVFLLMRGDLIRPLTDRISAVVANRGRLRVVHLKNSVGSVGLRSCRSTDSTPSSFNAACTLQSTQPASVSIWQNLQFGLDSLARRPWIWPYYSVITEGDGGEPATHELNRAGGSNVMCSWD